MEAICPRCQLQFEIDPSLLVPLNASEKAVFDALDLVQNGQPVKTQIIADAAGYSYDWAVKLLVALERREIVQRPRGPRSGWIIPHSARHRVMMQLELSA